MRKVGTLKELDVKPGDMLECVRWKGNFYLEGGRYQVVTGFGGRGESVGSNDMGGVWRVISRAADNREPTETKPKLWRDMTAVEKGALLLAHHEGKTIEFKNDTDTPNWKLAVPHWAEWCYYRVKPEPDIQTVQLMNFHELAEGYAIVFDVVNGEPDCASIKMGKLLS